MSFTTWLILTAGSAWLFARLSKIWPKVPKGLLPWLTLVVGYGFALLKLRFVGPGGDAAPLAWIDAATSAWYGLGAGLLAVGGHEALKPLLGRVFGEKVATMILGKLPAPALPKKAPPAETAKKAGAASMLVLGVALLSGCGSLLQTLSAVSQGSQWLSSLLDVAEAGSSAYFNRHPNLEREQAVRSAVERARRAAAALDAAISTAEAADEGDLATARQEALAAYGELRGLLAELGVLDAVAPPGGAESEAPAPAPIALPTPGELGKAL